MGAVFRWIRVLYLFFAAPTRRLVIYPTTGVPVGLTGIALAWPAWPLVDAGDEIVAAGVLTKAIRIYQIDITNPSAVVDYEVQIGYGAVAAAMTWFGAVTYNLAGVTLPFPLEVPAGQRLAARCRDSAVAQNTVDVKILAYTIE